MTLVRVIGGVQEGRLQVVVFLRISAVERIPLNEKCNILCKYVRFLGMINGNGFIPCPEKVIAIVCMERPMDVKSIHTVFGPFPIVKQHTANSFELDLGTSASKRVINVFRVKYLRHAPENDPYQQPNSQQVLPVSGSGDDEEWELEKILDKRTRRLKRQNTLSNSKGSRLTLIVP